MVEDPGEEDVTESEKTFISRAVLDDHKRQMGKAETITALIAAVLIVQAILWGSHCLLVMSYAGPWQIATEVILVLLSAALPRNTVSAP